jgi:hypothetical protein
MFAKDMQIPIDYPRLNEVWRKSTFQQQMTLEQFKQSLYKLSHMSHLNRIDQLKSKRGDDEVAEAIKSLKALSPDEVYGYFIRLYIPFETPNVYRDKMRGYQDPNVLRTN